MPDLPGKAGDGRGNGDRVALLTDEQWSLVEPLVSVEPPSGRGRHPVDRRAVLDGALLKHLTGLPWYLLPLQDPSWQSCYLAITRWACQGIVGEIFHILFKDLIGRGGFVFDLEVIGGMFEVKRVGRVVQIVPCPDLEITWQSTTALILFQAAIARSKKRACSHNRCDALLKCVAP